MERRRRYFIDRNIQLSFLKFVLSLLVIVSIFFSFMMLRINRYLTEYIISTVEEIVRNPDQQISSTHLAELKKEFARKDVLFVLEICFAVLLLGGIISLLTIRFTHRLAGPVYKIQTVLDRVLGGDYSQKIILREKDLLKDVTGKINRLIENIERRRPG